MSNLKKIFTSNFPRYLVIQEDKLARNMQKVLN